MTVLGLGAGCSAGAACTSARAMMPAVSDITALARQRLRLGHALQDVARDLELDAEQLAALKLRRREPERPLRPRKKHRRTGKPPAGWR